MTDIHVRFVGGKRIEAKVGGHHIFTDQSLAHGGDDSAPEPFDLFLASLVACAGLYVLGYCNARNIPSGEIELIQRPQFDDAGHLTRIALELALPAGFPERDRAGVVRAAQGCKVKKALLSPPEIVISARIVAADDQNVAATTNL
jgi:ribosomal protein S12 methylthiotransferase accessory factor